jgi:hypothetical protein
MTIADHGEPSVARRLVITTAGAVAAGTTGVGCGRTVAAVLGHPCAQHRHGRDLRSRRLRDLVCRLDRPTVCGLIVDDDRGARVELVPDLRDFGREWDFVDTIVSPLARDERFDDAAQGFRTQHAVRNHHRRDASLLRTAPPSWRSRRCWHGSRGEMDPSHAGRGPEAFPPEHASHPHPISSRERSAAPPACSP